MGAADKAAAIAKAEETYVAFRDLIMLVPPERFAEPVAGEWDLSDELAHLAGWYRELARGFARIAAGEQAYAEDYNDVDRWNAKLRLGKVPGAGALDDYDLAFHDFYAAAKACPDDFWGEDGGHQKPATALFLGTTVEHQAEHRAAIEAWLNRR